MVSGLWEEKGWYNEAEGEGEGDGRGEDIYGQTFHGLGEGGIIVRESKKMSLQ